MNKLKIILRQNQNIFLLNNYHILCWFDNVYLMKLISCIVQTLQRVLCKYMGDTSSKEIQNNSGGKYMQIEHDKRAPNISTTKRLRLTKIM